MKTYHSCWKQLGKESFLGAHIDNLLTYRNYSKRFVAQKIGANKTQLAISKDP